MSDPYVGEIRIFGFDFAPNQWALCNGQILPVKQNEALFSLIRYTYGGNGTTFALPNFQGLRPVMFGQGQGPNLSNYAIGQTGGEETVQLLLNQLASHSHAASADSGRGGATPGPTTVWSEGPVRDVNFYTPSSSSNVLMSATVASSAGGGRPHNNMQPYLTLNFCIALAGIYPQTT